PEDRTMETALGIFGATDASPSAVEKLFTPYRAPIQSFVYASDQGDIGLILPGAIPMRRADNPVKGLLPGNGRDPRFDWQGHIPYAEGPHWAGRENDMFISANNNVVPQGYPHQIALDFDQEHRARRIKFLLSNRDEPDTVTSFRAIQLDDGEQFAMDVLPPMLARTSLADERGLRALTLLKAWDMHMAPERAEPLIYAAWMRQFTKALAADELGDLFERVWSDRPDLVTALLKGDPVAVSFCDDVTTKDNAESCEAILASSLDAALNDLAGRYGGDMSAWSWGTAHQATFSHSPFGFVPVLRDVFGLREVMGGGNFTIQRASYRASSREPFAAVHGSGYRAVYDLGAPNASIFMIATGQSGNVYSPYYGNLAPRWAKGEYLAMTTGAAEIESHAVATLVLQPSSSVSSR
ncbi:MAG: penicillin acylase family protein, partial [Alphaproteobacteria bacterium]|nr:penicillin acylase family protein [Alphaproteobacteria bacterium]